MSKHFEVVKPPLPKKRPPLTLIFKEDIHFQENLGKGNYGIVKRAKWSCPDEKIIDVAVKILLDATDSVRKDIEAEIQIMSKLHHPNLVELYGVVLSDPMFMVMEFCDGGSLLDRLRSSQKQVLLVTQLLNYALQIASGMKYLQEKGNLHRDLATRNVLLKNDDKIVKLCDFGLSRVLNDNDRIYNMKSRCKIAFSWSPPEALKFRRFSTESDVWSFGVTLWECFTYGEEPWIGFNLSRVSDAIESGERLRKPEKCSTEIYDLMLKCWALNPADRPNFIKLYDVFKQMKITIFSATLNHTPSTPAEMSIKKGEQIFVIEEITSNTIYGQNMTSGEFGRCPKSVLKKLESSIPGQPPEIIRPKNLPFPVRVINTSAKENIKTRLDKLFSKIDVAHQAPTGGNLIAPKPPPRKSSSPYNASTETQKKFVKTPVEAIKSRINALTSSVANVYVDNEKSKSLITNHHVISGEPETETLKVERDGENFDNKKEIYQQNERNKFWKLVGLLSVTVAVGALTGIILGAPVGICIAVAVIACANIIISFLFLV